MFGLTPWKKEASGGRELMHPWMNLRNEFRTLFDRLMSPELVPFEPFEWVPENFWALEVKNLEKEVFVRAEVPGFAPGEFELRMFPENPERLYITAEHKVEVKEEEKKEPRFTETSVRRYERMVTLPAAVDPTKAEAKYVNGVLELHLPRVKEAEAMLIPVRT